MKMYDGMELQIIFKPRPLYPGEIATGNQRLGGWRASEPVEKENFLTLPGLKLRPFGRPARNQSLHRLHSPGSKDEEIGC
jgi:hypothetical protein